MHPPGPIGVRLAATTGSPPDLSAGAAEDAATAPMVTVLMPVYNGQRYLDEAIDSVLGQDFADFEFLIVDDGSTDATPRILQSWARRDERIRLHWLPENVGVAGALNAGLRRARGRYVCRQDADDLCVPGRVLRQVATLDRDAEVVLVSAGFDVIDASGRCIGRKTQAFAPEVTAYLLHFINAVGGHGQVMFRREFVLGLGGYREEFNLSEDYDLWARLSHLGKIVTLPVVGMKHRRHAESVSARFWQDQEHQARRVSGWMMAELLGRGLSEEEEQALGALWRDACMSAPASRTHAILWEAYRHFTRRGAGFGKRHNVRYEMAHRWCSSGLNLAGRGLIARAAAHMGYGLRWHPGIVFGGGGYVARLVGRKLRALQPATDFGVADPIIDPGSAEESGPRVRRG